MGERVDKRRMEELVEEVGGRESRQAKNGGAEGRGWWERELTSEEWRS